jgi:TonB family protein
MFSQLHPAAPKRQVASLSISLAIHLLFLGWLLHNPAPIFVAPLSVAKGESGSSLTRIYFGGDSGVTQEQPKTLTLQRPPKLASPHRLEPPAAKREAGNEIATARPGGPAAGSLYGSLSYGTFTGPEIRPALPIVSPDVIVEITIDEAGAIVQKIVIQSLGPAVDQKVLAALENWRFTPASKNGVPIPSKQDVYYHFPR